MAKKILIVDDDLYMIKLLDNYLQKEGYQTHTVTKGKPALKLLVKKSFDLVLCDIRLPDIEGSVLLSHILKVSPNTAVVMMTAYAEIRDAVRCIKSGAFDYVTKPILPENISNVVKKALASKELPESFDDFEFISGTCEKIVELTDQAMLVAPTDMSVLIQGETGSGKEYIARMIHHYSQRKNKRFVALDCGAIPKELAASELFGHVKGAFTGAITDKTGFLKMADGGTIFLDEIGNLSYDTQVKLLRAIHQKIITRVGDTKPIPVDVRIISASNSNLTINARDGNFREDLYHRINEFKLELPPLRERGNDIILFATHFLKQANHELNRRVEGFDPEVITSFKAYPWYGNLREMRNVIKRSVLLAKNNMVSIECLPEEIRFTQKENSIQHDHPNNEWSLKETVLLAEKTLILKALKQCGNNKTEAARLLNIDRKTLYNKIKILEIE